MKFTAFKSNNRKMLSIIAEDKGINLTKPTLHLEKGELGLSTNVTYKNGSLKTRDGFSAENKYNFVNEYNENSFISNYKLTNVEYYLNGEKMRVAVNVSAQSDNEYDISVFLIGKKGRVQSIGTMEFLRTADDVFFIPQSYLIFTAAANSGAGIYAFVTLKNCYSEERSYLIFELDDELSAWNRCTQFYIPTVYFDGKGTDYEMALSNGNVSRLSPTVAEPMNLLYKMAEAYFTTDGFSHTFKLPFTNIENALFRCKIYIAPDKYINFEVGADKNSATITLDEQAITLLINRVTGTFSFLKNGEPFIFEAYKKYGENNMRVTFSLTDEEVAEDIISCRFCEKVGNYIVFGGGRQKNRLFYCEYDKPLYFPKAKDNKIGAENKGITGLIASLNSLYAFKENEIFKVKLSGGKAINELAELSHNGKIFHKAVCFNAETVSNDCGCSYPDTLSRVLEKPVFMGEDYGIYTVSQGGIKKVSEKFAEYFNFLPEAKLKSAKGFCIDAKYYLFVSNEIMIIDFKDDVKCYLWKVPSGKEIFGCFKSENDLIFLFKNINNNLCYTALLSGEKDIYLKTSNTTETFDIPTALRLKSHYLSNSKNKKYLHTANFGLSAKEHTTILIGEGDNKEKFVIRRGDFSSNNQDNVKLLCDLKGMEAVDITINSKGSICFSKAELYFTELLS